MKKYIIVLIGCLITISIYTYAQKKNGKNKPKEHIIVNKEYDENGNLIRYDSSRVVVHSYSRGDDMKKMKMIFINDSTKKIIIEPGKIEEYFNQNFHALKLDSIFSNLPNFHHQFEKLSSKKFEFMMEEFEKELNEMKKFNHKIDSMYQHFFKNFKFEFENQNKEKDTEL